MIILVSAGAAAARVGGGSIRDLFEHAFHHDADQITDRSQRFIAAETREKIMRQLGQEVPVEILPLKSSNGLGR